VDNVVTSFIGIQCHFQQYVITWCTVLLVFDATFKNVSGIRYNMVTTFICA